VQVKNKRERSWPVRPPGVEKTSRLDSRDPVASRVKCGPHGGKNSNMKSVDSFLVEPQNQRLIFHHECLALMLYLVEGA
jgi:hypothetical protein